MYFFHFFPARSLPFKIPKFLHFLLDRYLGFMIYFNLKKEMCGIVSIHSSGKPLDQLKDKFKKMLSKVGHRGPDGEGIVHIENQVMLGHKRLAIIDLESGNQPMFSDDNRFIIIFNGEIYNYLELRSSTRRKSFQNILRY